MSTSSRCASPAPRLDRRALIALACAAPWCVRAQAALPELPGWVQRGQGRMRFLGLSVYDIALWSPTPLAAADWAQQPLALALTYARSLKGKLIAERSLQEMRRQTEIDAERAARWLQAMQACFPDVADGDRLTGRHDPQTGARFWFRGRLHGEIADPEFSRLFFGIWLSAQTSEPGLRTQLLRPA